MRGTSEGVTFVQSSGLHTIIIIGTKHLGTLCAKCQWQLSLVMQAIRASMPVPRRGSSGDTRFAGGIPICKGMQVPEMHNAERSRHNYLQPEHVWQTLSHCPQWLTGRWAQYEAAGQDLKVQEPFQQCTAPDTCWCS